MQGNGTDMESRAQTETSDTSAEETSTADEVEYQFVCEDLEDTFHVLGFRCVEELGRPYRMTLDLIAVDEATDTTNLLGRDAQVLIHREGHTRAFHGVVCRVLVGDNDETRQSSTIQIAPALQALALTINTRIFQDRNALDIVETVLREGLAPYQRHVDSTGVEVERIPPRDYCVQYRESDLDFVHRLLEEEGIGYYFEQETPEKLVLFDVSRTLPRALTMDGGPVRFDRLSRAVNRAEPVHEFELVRQLTSSSLVVRDHDWRRARPTLEEGAQIAKARGGLHDHSVYQHGFDQQVTLTEDADLAATMFGLLQSALLPNGLPPGLEHLVLDLPGAAFDVFSSDDAKRQVGLRSELLGRDATTNAGRGVVIDFSPGRTFELVGHRTLGADGEYLLTRVVHSSRPLDAEGTASASATRRYFNRFECMPLASPWRPARRTRKPRIYGVQTARVTGPAGMDVYTDPHGRIRVQFAWDREPCPASGHSSCWLRVSQAWAGQGAPGFVFIPRVGMEVVVSFVDGDPDRPMVTGCVYNGANATPGLLPVQATKSIIRTRTVPHGPGHNELSFEDAMGMERVHIRAERDLDELVLHDHVTDVRQNQQNFVGLDQTERIGRHQRVMVMGHREVQVEGRITEHSGNDFFRAIGGSGTEQYGRSYHVTVEHGSAVTEVLEGEFVASAVGNIGLIQNQERMVKLSSEGDEAGILLNSNGAVIHVAENRILLRVGRSSIEIEDGLIRVNNKVHPA